MFHHRIISTWLIELRGERWLHTLNPNFLWKKKSVEENGVSLVKVGASDQCSAAKTGKERL